MNSLGGIAELWPLGGEHFTFPSHWHWCLLCSRCCCETASGMVWSAPFFPIHTATFYSMIIGIRVRTGLSLCKLLNEMLTGVMSLLFHFSSACCHSALVLERLKLETCLTPTLCWYRLFDFPGVVATLHSTSGGLSVFTTAKDRFHLLLVKAISTSTQHCLLCNRTRN